ncbi:uncharacterized protein LOC101847015 [Aplysia californica]|uniref:Uncharacterized protein LOC101847015 n=1 Tax=Aplysia californica TaxID=6500 RepID=A0ABM0KB24_APLCA|nr:uncharacterized protein LOC101847015 [Aplysia californica]
MASGQPSNTSELQLYRVLQRANLLQYFETFITQGGDDVQQLCEAGEDEFLEIMALVGMASKPLHVRRLQKALQEWVANPPAFEAMKKYPTHVMSMTGSSPSHSLERSSVPPQDFKVTPPQSSTSSTSTPWTSQRGASPSDGSNLEHPSPSDSPQEDFKDVMLSNEAYNAMMNMPQPALLEHQITAIASAAAVLAQDLPPFEPKSLPKKQISKEIQTVMLMSSEDPIRMDALRKYAAIYGRFDSKRKNDKPMSLHEISVNEAAAQLCSHFPALLTRREELFPLARQVVRDSGYQYSKGHSRPPKSEVGPDISQSLRAAEVVVPPKSEPCDVVSTSPSTSSSPRGYDKTFNDLQTELTDITLSLSEMVKEQDRIRSALRVLLETNDHEQMRALTAEMDVLNDRQTLMTKRRQSLVNMIAKYRKNPAKYSPPVGASPSVSPRYSSTSNTLSSGTNMKTSGHGRSNNNNNNNHHSINNNNNNGLKFNSAGGAYTLGYTDELGHNPLNTLYIAALQNSKDSLFEEGLRIATQYGMSDFAQELIGMKSNEKLVEDTDSDVKKQPSEVLSSSESSGRKSSPSTLSSSPSAAAPAATVYDSVAMATTPIHALTTAATAVAAASATSSSPSRKSPGSPPAFVSMATVSVSDTPPRLSAAPSPAGSRGSQGNGGYRDCGNGFKRDDMAQAETRVNASPSSFTYSDADSKSSNPALVEYPRGSDSLSSLLPSTDGSVDFSKHSLPSLPATASNGLSPQDGAAPPVNVTAELIAGSTTTTTTITTKSGQVIEVETRRSSRRKNGEPDYYLINGGEKRFRSSGGRRSSSTSSERAARLSSSSMMTSSSPSPVTSPCKVKNDFSGKSDEVVRMNVSDLRNREGYKFVNKTILDVNQMGKGASSFSDTGYPDDLDLRDTYIGHDQNHNATEKRVGRKKSKLHYHSEVSQNGEQSQQ